MKKSDRDELRRLCDKAIAQGRSVYFEPHKALMVLDALDEADDELARVKDMAREQVVTILELHDKLDEAERKLAEAECRPHEFKFINDKRICVHCGQGDGVPMP